MNAGFLATALGVSMLVCPAVLGPALLRVRGAVAFAVAGLVLAAAEIVVLSTLLSVGAHYRLGWMLATEALVALAVFAAWLHAGRPRLPAPRLPAGSQLRAHPVIVVLAGAAAIALAIQLFQALAVVSNGWDPNVYHLSRAAYWLQYHSVSHFPGGSPRENGYPPDAEILQGWTMMLTHGDALVNLIQWVAVPGLAAATFLGSRAMGFPRAGAAFAALIVATLPIPILQATTADSDVICAFFVLVAAVFGIRAIRDGHAGEAGVAAIALALAIGTKGIAIVAGPSLLVIWGATAVISKAPWRRLALYGGFVVLSFAALAMSFFVQNLRDTHSLYGHANDVAARTTPILQNSIDVDWRYLSFPGSTVDWADVAASNAGLALSTGNPSVESGIDHITNDSSGGFGPIVPLFLFPALLWFLIARGVSPQRRALAAGSTLFFLIFPFVLESDPDLTRLALSGVVLGAPLLAAVAGRPGAAAVAATIAVTVLGSCVLQNPLKRLLVREGQVPAFSLSRNEQLALNRPRFDQVLDRFDRRVAPTTPIAFVGVPEDWDYPFFGPHLSRRVYRFDDTRDLANRMRALGVRTAVMPSDRPPPGFEVERLGQGWTLLTMPAG